MRGTRSSAICSAARWADRLAIPVTVGLVLRWMLGHDGGVEEVAVGRIVVGIDGSEHSVRALEHALQEARAHDADIEAVYVLPDPVPMWAAMPEAMYYPVDEPEKRVEEAREQLGDIIEDVRSRSDVRCEVAPRIEEGPPARTLLRVAADADLLVVGTRGLGGFRGLLLGSVSHQCVSHATCPVLVVPPPPEDETL